LRSGTEEERVLPFCEAETDAVSERIQSVVYGFFQFFVVRYGAGFVRSVVRSFVFDVELFCKSLAVDRL